MILFITVIVTDNDDMCIRAMLWVRAEHGHCNSVMLPTAAAHTGLEADWRRHHRCLGVWLMVDSFFNIKPAHLFRGILTGSGLTNSN